MLFAGLCLAAVQIAASAASAASTTMVWTDTSLPEALNGSFVLSFDATPKAVTATELAGISQNAATSTADLAALILFNGSGQIQASNGGTYGANTPVSYVANAKYHFRIAVSVPEHKYNVLVTPPGQAEIVMAKLFAFPASQATIPSLSFINVGAATGNIVVSGVIVQSVKQAGCAYSANATAAGINDGCGGASNAAVPYPSLLTAYSTHRPPFDVAGVDYAVGVPAGTLLDPTTAALPAGCTLGGTTVTCKQANTTVSGYDFSLHGGIQFNVVSTATNIQVTGNKFAIGPSCRDPVIIMSIAGSDVFSHNTLNGAGSLCDNKLVWGTMLSLTYATGSTLTIEYNEFYNTPQDVTDNSGPRPGTASIVERYNLFYLQGYTGHPDGIQLNGGNFDPIDLSFNTYFTSSPPTTDVATQPLHLEAQLTAAISHSTVSYNTVITPGTCSGGHAWPTGCTVNYDIACKSDGSGDSNTSYAAFGNYIDWSGAISAFDNEGCGTAAVWGSPKPNIDLKTGTAIAD
jgi:hypothetical protein